MRTLKRILGATVAGAGLVAAVSMTAAAAPPFVKGTIDANGGLNGRIAPSVHTSANYLFKDGDKVSIDCRTKGTIVGGNAEWYLISGEGDANWVSAKYVDLAGAAPDWCGPDESISVTITKDVYSRQGPSTADKKRRLQHPGGQEALCYTYTNISGGGRWVVTTEDGWVPASAVKSSKEIPFCER
ncbi:hypothetical protein [Microlunatus speluncae]|uniref:hypothetical protein n=1 Tax=Microlunatus speluncae TaxID=2594267 RepID=UPI00126688D7|nr:hypothetical protein [Microlunatus speluncae]